MRHFLSSCFAVAGGLLIAAVVPGRVSGQVVSSASLNGRIYLNRGLVGVGRIPAATKDKFGETFGSFSAFTIDPRTWRRNADGSYAGTLYAQPDRGYNGAGTTNYVPRFNKLTFTFTPSSGGGQNQVALTLSDSVKYSETNGTPFTSLDPVSGTTGVRTGFPALPQAYNGRLSLDAEGIILNPDGTLWISDEYGPYVFKFAADGKLLSVIRPPEALIPKRNGADSFASNNPQTGQPVPSPADPATGRQNNQGLEGLCLSPDGRTLFTLLQSATRQEGGTGGSSAVRYNTRLLAYDLTGATPVLKAEYVLQLPTYLQGTATRVAAQSELLAISNTQFLVIARDSGNGRGLLPTSVFRSVMIYDITGATNIAGTYDSPTTLIAPGGTLVSTIVPAARAEFINLNDSTQLARFGLHNGPTDDANNLSEKWEALALAPALDPSAPDDWFLFVGNDNDFITQNGFQDGGAYADATGVENDSMVLVYRLTLPSRIVNTSSRASTGGANGSHIMGFVVTGTRPKTMLIRGVGPTLTSYGVAGVAADPSLALFGTGGSPLFSNDNWGEATNAADVRAAAAASGAFPLAEGGKDAALLVALDPGAYTAEVSAPAAGITLLEIYELP